MLEARLMLEEAVLLAAVVVHTKAAVVETSVAVAKDEIQPNPLKKHRRMIIRKNRNDFL